MKGLLQYIIEKSETVGVKHKVYQFDSGAIMIDIWINNKFYAIEIYRDVIGLSEVTKETTPFDIIPDKSFKDPEEFKTAFELILLPHE
jgi:hypothetical protein